MSYEEKLKKAKEFLGTKYLLHPNKHVKKGRYEEAVDVKKTLNKVKKKAVHDARLQTPARTVVPWAKKAKG